jgi:phosphodiesterase/alkaline phosphatase D-like protein
MHQGDIHEGLEAFEGIGAPNVVTDPAGDIEATTAVLNGTVNPDGQAVKSCAFEYGPAKTLGKSLPCTSLPAAGTSPVAVTANLTGLSAKTKYSFRITASNATGTDTGAEVAFKTKK